MSVTPLCLAESYAVSACPIDISGLYLNWIDTFYGKSQIVDLNSQRGDLRRPDSEHSKAPKVFSVSCFPCRCCRISLEQPELLSNLSSEWWRVFSSHQGRWETGPQGWHWHVIQIFSLWGNWGLDLPGTPQVSLDALLRPLPTLWFYNFRGKG